MAPAGARPIPSAARKSVVPAGVPESAVRFKTGEGWLQNGYQQSELSDNSETSDWNDVTDKALVALTENDLQLFPKFS